MNEELLKPFFLANKVFSVTDFAHYHQLDAKKAAIILARLAAQKKLLRIQRGFYLPVAHRGLNPEETFSDPWSIIPAIFPEAIVSGWSAAHFWGLTEQLFNTTIIFQKEDAFTTKKKVGPYTYMIFKAQLGLDFGVESTWREAIEVPIADVHRCVIDMLENPKSGGGIQHTIDCVKTYLSEYSDNDIFIKYAQHIKNGVFFKRLGYVGEILLGEHSQWVKLAYERMTKGPSVIDAHLKCMNYVNRWNLYVSPEIKI